MIKKFGERHVGIQTSQFVRFKVWTTWERHVNVRSIMEPHSHYCIVPESQSDVDILEKKRSIGGFAPSSGIYVWIFKLSYCSGRTYIIFLAGFLVITKVTSPTIFVLSRRVWEFVRQDFTGCRLRQLEKDILGLAYLIGGYCVSWRQRKYDKMKYHIYSWLNEHSSFKSI